MSLIYTLVFALDFYEVGVNLKGGECDYFFFIND